jgi:hypothetical protein
MYQFLSNSKPVLIAPVSNSADRKETFIIERSMKGPALCNYSHCISPPPLICPPDMKPSASSCRSFPLTTQVLRAGHFTKQPLIQNAGLFAKHPSSCPFLTCPFHLSHSFLLFHHRLTRSVTRPLADCAHQEVLHSPHDHRERNGRTSQRWA